MRRIYESYNLDINACSFKDLYDKVAENRDLSDEAIKVLYQGGEGQKVIHRTLITVEDSYGLLE